MALSAGNPFFPPMRLQTNMKLLSSIRLCNECSRVFGVGHRAETTGLGRLERLIVSTDANAENILALATCDDAQIE